MSGRGSETKVPFNEDIKAIAANEEIGLVLLNNHQLWKIDLQSEKKNKSLVNFLNIEAEGTEDEVTFIAATLRGFYAISRNNIVYSIPTQIGSLPKSSSVIKLTCGHEHCLALLDNGELFAWGGGL